MPTINYENLNSGFYAFLEGMIKQAEGLDSIPKDIGDGTITFGHGYTFFRNGEPYGYIVEDFREAGIGPLTGVQEGHLESMMKPADRQAAIVAFIDSWTQQPLTASQAGKLLRQEIPRQISELKRLAEGKGYLNSESDAKALFSALNNTRELAVLVDAKYMGTFGPKLIRALANGDRAEAWFELRYAWALDKKPEDHPKNANNGWARRHFMQSTIFGLYHDSSNVSADEVTEAFEMLRLHRERIADYEIDSRAKFREQMINILQF